MKITELEKLIKASGSLIKAIQGIYPNFGFIHNTEVIIKDGIIEGYIIWDYILYNEISYITADGKNRQRLFTSTCDITTELKFQEICEKYSIA